MTRLPAMVERDGLRVHVPPGVVFFNDVWIEGVCGLSARLLLLLMVSYPTIVPARTVLEMFISKEARRQTRIRLRAALRRSAAPFDVLNHPRVGDQLVMVAR